MVNIKSSAIFRLFRIFMVVAIVTILLGFPDKLPAQGTEQAIAKVTECPSGDVVCLEKALNNLWVLVAGILVLTMQLGFAMLEAGFNASKNTVNVLFKNVADACVGIIVYFCFGYALMYRPETCQAIDIIPNVFGIGISYLGLSNASNECTRQVAEHLSVYIDFFFQAAFAATAATICSGAVAGRIKPWAYLLLAFLITGLVYPVSGYWVWGGGWLSQRGFHDLAGSVVVHGVGGGAALAIVNILKPRIGKFDSGITREEKDQLSAHSLPLAAMGTFILWIGWYGFNAGSTLGIVGVEDSSPNAVGRIVVNTTLSACSSVCTAIVYRSSRKRKIDLATVLNCLLGGLVAITASCDVVSPAQALMIGVFAGLVVIGGINWLNEQEIDDAVGAIPVHCFCGILGGLAPVLFPDINDINTLTQIVGSFLIPIFSFVTIWILFKIINSKFGIRVEEDEEKGGLDLPEHGEYAYISLEKKEDFENHDYF